MSVRARRSGQPVRSQAPDAGTSPHSGGAPQRGNHASPQASPRGRRGFAPTLILGAALLAALGSFIDVLGDPDLWWHLRLGGWILDNHAIPRGELFSYTGPGSPMTAHEWLADVVLVGLRDGIGLLGVALVVGLLAWSGLVATALRARRLGAPVLAVAGAVLLGAKAMQPVTGTRVQMLSFALTAWTLLLAERHLDRGGRAVWWLPPIFLLWANVHAQSIFGLGILALSAGLAWIESRDDPVRRRHVRPLGAAVGVSALVCCLNPAGVRLYAFALNTSSSESSKPITEWQSPNFHLGGEVALLLLLCAWLALAALVRGPGLRQTVLALVGFAAVLISVRSSSLAVALAMPGLAVMLGRTGSLLPGRLRHLRIGGPVPVACLAGGALVLGVVVSRAASDAGATAEVAAEPACAVAVLDSVPGTVDVFASYADSSYVVERGWPHLRVYEYGESISLGRAVFDDFLRISSGATSRPSALTLLAHSHTDAVLAAAGSDLDAELAAAAGGWQHVATDHGRDVWLRDGLRAPVTGC